MRAPAWPALPLRRVVAAILLAGALVTPAYATAAPMNLGPPGVSGEVRVGQTVGCMKGVWLPDAQSYSYAWQIGGAAIPGATLQVYKIAATDKGKDLACVETANDVGGSSSATSAAVTVAAAQCPVVGGKPTCLRVGRQCRPEQKADLLRSGFECVRKGKGRKKRYVLKRASEAKLRGDAFVYLRPEDGLPSFDTALQAFDKQIADLPGVKTEKGVVGESYEGTSALRWIGHYEDRLTPAQKAVVESVRNPPPQAKAAAESPVIGSYRNMVDEAKRRLAAHGVNITHPITVRGGAVKGASTWAEAVPRWLYKTGNDCLITITPAGELALATDGESLLVHELTHCAQAEPLSTTAAWEKMANWIAEGGAEWSGATIAHEWKGVMQPNARARYDRWLVKSDRDLFTRSYDAIGWYQVLKHEGVDVFPLLIEMSNLGGNISQDAAYHAGSDQSISVFLNWGATGATTPRLGDPWDLNIPGYPRTSSYLGKQIRNGTKYLKTIPRRGAYALELDVKTDVLSIDSDTLSGRFYVNGHDRRLDAAEFCVKADGCGCPDGTDLGLEKLDPTDVYVGWSGSAGEATVSLAGESVEERCKGRARRQGIMIYQETGTSNEPLVGLIKTGKCRVAKGAFHAEATSTDGQYKLTVDIKAFKGFDERYSIFYGGADPTFVLEGAGGPYSNYPVPGPVGGGAIAFGPGGKAMSFGFAPTFNADFSQAVVMAGAMACQFPRKR